MYKLKYVTTDWDKDDEGRVKKAMKENQRGAVRVRACVCVCVHVCGCVSKVQEYFFMEN